MLTPSEIWPMLVAAAGIVYGAGHIVGSTVTKMQNGKYITKEYCSKQHELTNDKFESIVNSQAEILQSLHDIKAWINKDGIA